MVRGIVITPDFTVSIKEFGEPLHETFGEAVGGYIEIVHPRRLPAPYVIVVNEEGLLLNLPVNPFGCLLYETDRHGSPIVGTIVIAKEGFNEDEEWDVIGLDDDDLAKIFPMIQKFGSIAW